MSAWYAFTDPSTDRKHLFYGYPYACTGAAPRSCPYLLQQGNDVHCTHPNGRVHDCGSIVSSPTRQ
jgi:hypothetical protein